MSDYLIIMKEIEGVFCFFFPWEGSGYKESRFGNFELEKLVDNQNGYVYHMQFDVWVWTFRKEVKIQESSAHTWQWKEALVVNRICFCGQWQLPEPCGQDIEGTQWKASSGLVEGSLDWLSMSLTTGRPRNKLISVT